MDTNTFTSRSMLPCKIGISQAIIAVSSGFMLFSSFFSIFSPRNYFLFIIFLRNVLLLVTFGGFLAMMEISRPLKIKWRFPALDKLFYTIISHLSCYLSYIYSTIFIFTHNYNTK